MSGRDSPAPSRSWLHMQLFDRKFYQQPEPRGRWPFYVPRANGVCPLQVHNIVASVPPSFACARSRARSRLRKHMVLESGKPRRSGGGH